MPPEGRQRGPVDGPLDLGAAHAAGHAGQLAEVDAVGERLAPRVYPQDAPARAGVGQRHLDDAVEPAGAEQGGIDNVEPVGRADYEHVAELFEPVYLGEYLRDDALRDARAPVAASPRPPPRHERVDLVEEHDARRRLAGLAEHLAHALFGLADPL